MSDVKEVRFQPIGAITPSDLDGVDQVQAVRLADDKTGVVIADSDGKGLGIVLPVKDEVKPSDEVIDTVSVDENAARDAGAVTAALFKGDVESAGMLLGFYESDPVAQAKLCSSLAGIACAVLKTVDRLGDEITTVHGIPFPSSRQVLDGVLLKLAESQ